MKKRYESFQSHQEHEVYKRFGKKFNLNRCWALNLSTTDEWLNRRFTFIANTIRNLPKVLWIKFLKDNQKIYMF